MAEPAPPLVYPPMVPSVVGYLVCNSILGFLSVVVLVLRFWGRRMGLGVGVDDWLILAAEPLALCGIVFQGIHSSLGIGYDTPSHPELAANLLFMLKIIYVQQIVYLFALGAIKASVLFFYLRIFGTSGWTRMATYATLALTGVWMVGYVFGAAFLCQPARKQFEPMIEGKCGNQLVFDESMVISNIITDIIIMVLPMWTIWKLKLRKGERLGLMAAFSLGLLVVVAGIFRIVYIQSADLTTNLTGTLPPSIFVSQIEPLLGIICVSIPMLAPIYKRYRKHTGSSRSRTRTYELHDSSGPSGLASQRSRKRGGGGWEMDMDVMRSTTVAGGNMPGDDKSFDGASSDKDLTLGAAPHGITVQTRYTVTRE